MDLGHKKPSKSPYIIVLGSYPNLHLPTDFTEEAKRSKTRKGNPHLRKLLIQAANGATKKRGSFYRSKYRKLKARLGSPNKAKVAVANRLARAIYKVLGGENYKDLGYMRGDPLEKQIGLLVRKLKKLGVDVKHENHQMIVSSRKVQVDDTGIVLS
jgi:hypothetical protein